MKRIRGYLEGRRGGPHGARRRRGERGAALAELAMVVPVMLVLLLVVFDLGRGFHAYLSVTNGARHAARVAAMGYSSWSRLWHQVVRLP